MLNNPKDSHAPRTKLHHASTNLFVYSSLIRFNFIIITIIILLFGYFFITSAVPVNIGSSVDDNSPSIGKEMTAFEVAAAHKANDSSDHRKLLVLAANINIGALLDNDTRIGKEIITSFKLAAQEVNESSDHFNLFFHFLNPGRNPLQAIRAADDLVSSKNAQFIITNGAWAETALLASIEAKVPIISFAGSAVDKPYTQHDQWPNLVEMVPDIKQQVKCIAEIVGNFTTWRKVIVIYEVDWHGSDSGAFMLLSDLLLPHAVEIEHRLVIPPFSSLSDPVSFIRNEVANLLTKQSRVFIVLKTSLESGVVLFKEAKEMRLVERGSAWIISDPLTGLLESANSSVISTMQGVLGVTTGFPGNGSLFEGYKKRFKKIFLADYPDEDKFEPSIYALRAYDSITAITEATAEKSNTSILDNLLSSNFSGLSGPVSFVGGELAQASALKIVNVVGKMYRELTTEVDFEEKWYDSINWPGGLRNQVPTGRAKPNDLRPLKIGVPGRTTFAKFVNVTRNPPSKGGNIYSGFCIDIFDEVLEILGHPFPYEFIDVNGSYDELVNFVANKTYDAAVGDITILANRSSVVEFTQPFTESGLTMLVTVTPRAQDKAWIFVKPFTGAMWAVTGFVLIYTMLIVWLLERDINPEFNGPLWNQLSTAMWFMCSSLFFAQREKVYNNYTRVVVLVWLFVALVLTSSYTANFSSLLTVPRLIPSVTDIQTLKDTGAKIGCDGDSFVRKYLEDVLGFHRDNIINISSELDYPEAFERGNISAAFLELPYQKAFLNQYCNKYTVAGNISNFVVGDRFGGLGFAFQKGSMLAENVSRAILTLSENGKLKKLQLKYFSPNLTCSQNSDSVDSLDWRSFWGLFLFSAGISAICYVLFSIHWIYEWWRASDIIERWKLLFIRCLHSRHNPVLSN